MSTVIKKVKVGSRLPDFSLPNQEGELVRIHDSLGKPVVIYFYPKDDTPGCTAQACGFRDNYADFLEYGALVFGISSDSEQSHGNFRRRHNLPFDLLSDKDNRVRDLFGVDSTLFGLIPGRVTYIADKEGIVKKVFDSQLQVKRHTHESLQTLQILGQGLQDDL